MNTTADDNMDAHPPQDVTPAAGHTLAETVSTHFATLCDDELLSVVRHASKVPNSTSWKTYLSPDDLHLLALPISPFKTIAGEVFSRVRLTEEYYRPKARTVTAVQLIQDFGSCINDLVIEKLPTGADLKQLIESISANCPQVTTLDICCHVDMKLWEPFMQGLMEAIGRQLKTLRFRPSLILTQRDMLSASYWITARCMNLTKIDIEVPGSASLEAIMPVWYTAGGTLKEITICSARIRSPHDWAQTLSEIREHCRRVVDFRVECNNYSKPPDEHLTELLASYWTQLQFAQLPEVGTERCEFLERACPRAKFSLEVGDHNVKGMLALGSRLTHVKMNIQQPPDTKLVAAAINSCTELTHISLCIQNIENFAFGAPFNRKKHCLRNLNLKIANFVLLDTSLSRVASATGKLRKLVIDVTSIRDATAFENIAIMNPQLEIVEIKTVRPSPVLTQVAIIRSFLVCEKINRIILMFNTWLPIGPDEQQELVDKCSFLRNRRIYCQVGRRILRG